MQSINGERALAFLLLLHTNGPIQCSIRIRILSSIYTEMRMAQCWAHFHQTDVLLRAASLGQRGIANHPIKNRSIYIACLCSFDRLSNGQMEVEKI